MGEKKETYYLHQTEQYKSLFDYVKSFWTMPAGGIAANIALLAAIAKEFPSVKPNIFIYSDTVGPILIVGASLISIISLVYSIKLCVDGQFKLVELVQESENIANTESENYEEKQETLKASLDKIRKAIISGKRWFYCGAICLIISAVLFFCILFAFSIFTKKGSEKMTITIKKISIQNGSVSEIELENISADISITAEEIEKIKTALLKQSP